MREGIKERRERSERRQRERREREGRVRNFHRRDSLTVDGRDVRILEE